MFAVAAGPGLALWDHDHGFHRDDHAGLKFGLDVLAELDSGFAAVVVAQDPKAVPVTKGPGVQQVIAPVDVVERGGDLRTLRAGRNQFETGLVHLDVDVPQSKVLIAHVLGKERPLQGDVVAKQHWKAVEREDVAGFDYAVGNRIVCAVGIHP